MGLAALLDLVGEALEAPVFGLGDLAPAFGDDVGILLRQRFDLRLGNVLARQENMLVQRHAMPFCSRFPHTVRGSLSLRRIAPNGPGKAHQNPKSEDTGERATALRLSALPRHTGTRPYNTAPFSLQPERVKRGLYADLRHRQVVVGCGGLRARLNAAQTDWFLRGRGHSNHIYDIVDKSCESVANSRPSAP